MKTLDLRFRPSWVLWAADGGADGGEGAAADGDSGDGSAGDGTGGGDTGGNDGAGSFTSDSGDTTATGGDAGGEGSGEGQEGGSEGGSEGGPQMPAWLAQASKEYQDRGDLWENKKIDDLIAERDKLAEKAKETSEAPEEYDLRIGEGDDEEATKAIAEKAKEHNLTQEQFDFMVEQINEHSKGIAGKLAETITAGYTPETANDLFQREWGKDFDIQYTNMRRGIKILGESFERFVNQTGAGNNPNVIRSLAHLGSLFGEDMTPLSESEGGMEPDYISALKDRYPSMF